MSEIRATTISDAAGTGPITLTGQSAAKSWSNFDGSSFGVRDSFNHSSVTDNGTGNYTPNFNSAMNGSNYSAIVSAGGSTALNFYSRGTRHETYSTTSYRFTTEWQPSSTLYDTTYVNTATFGDLA